MRYYLPSSKIKYGLGFILALLLCSACKKDKNEGDLPDTPSEMRLKEIEVYRNDSLILRKTMSYDDQSRLDEMLYEAIDHNNVAIPFKKHKFDYISDDYIQSAYFGKVGSEWLEDTRFTRLYENGRMIEFTASYSDESKAFYSYNAFGLSTIQYLAMPVKGSDTCYLEDYLYNNEGVLYGEDRYEFCKQADTTRKVRYVRDEQGLMQDIEIYAKYWSGEWDMNSKLELDYDQNGKVIYCLNHKYYKKLLTPVSEYSFEYFTDGNLKELLYTELPSGKNERYILSYEEGKGNFHELRTLYNYSTYGIWMPDINLSGHFPFYY